MVKLIHSQQIYTGAGRTKEKLGLRAILTDALTIMEVSLRKFGIKLETGEDPDAKIRVDRVNLIHVLINLIRNAIEALYDTPREERKIRISTRQAEGWIYITVRDNGCGILPGNRDKLFTMGYSTKNDGRGFGLHSCASYIAEMEGDIRVESTGEARGASFIIKLPLG